MIFIDLRSHFLRCSPEHDQVYGQGGEPGTLGDSVWHPGGDQGPVDLHRDVSSVPGVYSRSC